VKRTPLRRTSSLPRTRKPISPMSAKRRRDLPARKRCRILVLKRAEGLCEMRCTDPCRSFPNPATDVHELKRGASRSECWLNPEKCLAGCRECHIWVSEHPAAARELGLALWSWEEVAS
jgi:hypothetical protein